MFEGDPADTCNGTFPIMSMGGRAEDPACTDPEARMPIGLSGNSFSSLTFCYGDKRAGYEKIRKEELLQILMSY